MRDGKNAIILIVINYRFIQTAIIVPGSHVNVISKGLIYSTLSLLSTVFFFLFAIHMNSWKLDKKLGKYNLMGMAGGDEYSCK